MRDNASSAQSSDLLEANERLVIASLNAAAENEASAHTAKQMSHLAAHDSLTGLPNRLLLTHQLTQAIAFARRSERHVALIFIDLDGFKHINDSLGHAAGDQLLKSVSARIQSTVRGSDIVYRRSGDEFVVLLSEIRNADDAALVAGKIVEAGAAPHLTDDGQRMRVTFSAGVSVYPGDGNDAEALLKSADIAMYSAKKRGGDNFNLFDERLNARELELQVIKQALSRAAERKEFILHYQPKVNLTTFSITGAEALLRWRPMDAPPITTSELVRIGESCGLMLPIGKWVLREACRQTAAWIAADLDVRQIAVNISEVELYDRDFLSSVGTILNETGLPPQCLELELTEKILDRDSKSTLAILVGLRKLGVRIGIDDFGTGSASLSFLGRFPIDTVKIDKTLTCNIEKETAQSIISAIVAVGNCFGQRIVAEGIETPEQLAFLNSRHCTEGQGFLFSGGVIGDALGILLAKHTLRPRLPSISLHATSMPTSPKITGLGD